MKQILVLVLALSLFTAYAYAEGAAESSLMPPDAETQVAREKGQHPDNMQPGDSMERGNRQGGNHGGAYGYSCRGTGQISVAFLY